jgi:hypothetical protein
VKIGEKKMARKRLDTKHKGFYMEFRGKEEMELLNDFRRMCENKNIPIKSIVLFMVECITYDHQNHKTIAKLKKELGLDNGYVENGHTRKRC